MVASSAQAQSFTFAGQLDDAAGAADGLFDFELALTDGGGAVIWSETQPAVIVANGVFVLDVGASAPLPAAVPVRAQLVITVDDDVLPPLPLAHVLSVTRAQRAAGANTAPSATTLAGVTAAEVATRESLVASGGPSVAFGNVTGVPASIADGDNGIDVLSTSADLAISARRLDIATVSGTRLAAGSVSGNVLASSSITTGFIADGAVTGAKIADGVITRARVPGTAGGREIKTANVFRNAPGCEFPNELSTEATCPRAACIRLQDGAAGLRACDTDKCDALPQTRTTCGSTLLPQPIAAVVRE